MPTSVIAARHRESALMRCAGSLSALPSPTSKPSASTTQIEVVLSTHNEYVSGDGHEHDIQRAGWGIRHSPAILG